MTCDSLRTYDIYFIYTNSSFLSYFKGKPRFFYFTPISINIYTSLKIIWIFSYITKFPQLSHNIYFSNWFFQVGYTPSNWLLCCLTLFVSITVIHSFYLFVSYCWSDKDTTVKLSFNISYPLNLLAVHFVILISLPLVSFIC